MKILTWNCNGAFRKKIELLKEIDADIYIIQECESEEKSQGTYDSWLPNRIWKGHNKNKGLGVFAKEQFKLEQLYWEDSNLELFLPLKINDDFQLLAVWTKYANSPTFQYIGQLWKYLQLYNTAIATKATIICGDLNSNAQWDVWDRWWNHSDVVNQLKTMNIHSLYHELTNEEQGKEKNSTFFMNRNQEKNYHIDYLFSHTSLFSGRNSHFKIFDKDEWLQYSDHLPILFDLNT
ncbi:MAG: endonuclease/exonuclease/phosphatase family protein [Acinetobacter junii]